MSELSAGAITFKKADGQILYLVIRDFHGNYGFPKGHLEQGEGLEEAALREIFEETGISVKLHPSFCEKLTYVMPNGIEKTAVYFLGEYEKQTPHRQEEEVETILLLPYEEAERILTFENMKEVLRKADRFLKEGL